MGSSTSKIASRKGHAIVHFLVGPVALFIAFLGNALINHGTPMMYKPNGIVLLIGGIVMFLMNWYIGSGITVPNAVKASCNKSATGGGWWPAFMSVIGDPGIVMLLTYSTPLIILAPVIMTLLPVGPLTIGILMFLRKYLENVPVLGSIIGFFPITTVFDMITSSWIFIAILFLIGYNFWSWIGGAIAATLAIKKNC